MRIVLVVVFSLLLPVALRADTIEVMPASQLVPLTTDNLVTFNDMNAESYGSTAATGTFQAGGATFSGSALIMRNGVDGSLPSIGLYAEPYHDRSNYLAILGNSSEKVAFVTPRSAFGLYWGSIDSYNTISFWNKGVEIASYAGSDLAPLLPIPFGDQRNDGSNRYILFSGIGLFDTVVLGSGGNSFELDNITSSVPEPATWTMMLVGFLALAGVRNKRMKKAFFLHKPV